MNKKILGIVFLTAVFLASAAGAGNYFLADFNSGGSPNNKGGGYSVWAGADIPPPAVSKPALENSGYSLKFKYEFSKNYDLWMNLTNGGNTRDLSGYDYLSFWVKGSNGGELFEIVLKDNIPVPATARIQNFVSGGIITTNWQKVVIPMKAFNSGGFNKTIAQTVHFIGGVMSSGTSTGIIYIDDINFGTGLGTHYIDTMEFDEHKTFGGSDLTSYLHAVTNDVVNAGISFETNTLWGDQQAYGGHGSIRLLQIRTNLADEAFCNWILDLNGVNLTNCDKLVFAVKGATNRIAGQAPYVEICDTVKTNSIAMQAISTNWQEQTNYLAGFTALGLDKTKVTKIGFRSKTYLVPWTNRLWIDEIRIVDSIAPLAPMANFNYNGQLIISGVTVFTMGHNLTVTADSKTADSGMECVRFEFSTNGGTTWIAIGSDYDTSLVKTTYTVPWNSSSIPDGKFFDIRVVAMDSSGNVRVGSTYTGCTIYFSPFASVDLRHSPAIESNLSVSGGSYITTTVSSVTCRQTTGAWVPIYFGVNDSYAHGHHYDNYYYSMNVRYFDGPGDRIAFFYDAISNTDQVLHNSTIYRLATFHNTGRWTNITFDLPDACFSNRNDNANSDFSFKATNNLAISYIQIKKNPAKVAITCFSIAGVDTPTMVTVKITGANPASTIPVTLAVNGSAVITPMATQNLVGGSAVFYVSDSIVENVTLTATSGSYISALQPVSFIQLPPASVDLRHSPAIESNLTVTGGSYVLTNISGVTCRQTTGAWAPIYFGLNDSYVLGHHYDNYYYSMNVRYFDGPGDRIAFFYDAISNTDQVLHNSTIYRLATFHNTGRWTNITFDLPDACFSNRNDNANSDFSFKASTNLSISYIQIKKNPLKLSMTCSTEAGVGTLNKVTVKVVGANPASTVPITLTANGSAMILPSSTQNAAGGIAVFYVSTTKEENITLTASSGICAPIVQSMNFILLYGINDSKYVDIVLKATNVPDRLYLTGGSKSNVVGALWCRQSIPPAGVWMPLGFNIDDSFVYDRTVLDGYMYKIQVDYFDNNPNDGDNKIKCVYDGMNSGNQESPSQWIDRLGANIWKTYTFILSDCKFSNTYGRDFDIKAQSQISLKYVKVSKVNFIIINADTVGDIKTTDVTLTLKKNSVKIPTYLITRKVTSLAGIGGSSASVADWKFINGVDFMTYNAAQTPLLGMGFEKTANLVMTYDPALLGGTKPETLAIFYFNEQTKIWEKAGGTLDANAHTLSMSVFKSGKYAIFSAIQNDTIKVKWSSNPFSPNGDGKLDFTVLSVALPGPTSSLHVFIYDRKGMLIKELTRATDIIGDNYVWDGKDYRNNIVPVGPYIYQIRYDKKRYSGIIVVVK